jgi:hypothetical protein
MPINITNLISILDLYGKRVSLYTKSSTKATTCVGFIFTIISFLLFCLILYFELYEVFKREHPNVISSKHHDNSTLSITNNTMNFFININKDFEKDNFLQYFHIESYVRFEGIGSLLSISYENCTEIDKSYLQNFFTNFEFPIGTNICPRINYKEIENLESFHGFNIFFYIYECSISDKDCIADSDLYNRIRKGDFSINSVLKFVNNQIDMTNYENPYSFEMREFYSYSTYPLDNIIELEGTEINSQTLISFNAPIVLQSRFNVQSLHPIPKATEFNGFRVSFSSNNTYSYKRMYKTFNSAFATSFALFKLFNQIISIILSPIYTYYMNTIIINKNFNYELSTYTEGSTNTNKMRESTLELYNRKAKELSI